MKILNTTLFIFLACVNTACATESCIFSPNYFSENNYKNNQLISTYEWNNEEKEIKGVLESGYLFSIKNWSCMHNGTHAVLYLGPNLKEIPDNINKYVFQLAEIALKNKEIAILSQALNGKNLAIPTSPQKLSISNSEYSEFYVSYGAISEIIIIEIKLYRG